MPLLELTADSGEEVTRVDVDTAQRDRQFARLAVDDDAARRTQRMFACPGATRPGSGHQLVAVIVSEPVREACDDFACQLVGINQRWTRVLGQWVKWGLLR